jgi:hypothetical protein
MLLRLYIHYKHNSSLSNCNATRQQLTVLPLTRSRFYSLLSLFRRARIATIKRLSTQLSFTVLLIATLSLSLKKTVAQML